MIEPPSSSLLQLLSDLRLCTPRDLRRCRSRVRRLTHDLPAFDSVWIDALVQRQCLTPFQARILESKTPQRLKVGPCVLVDELGRGRQRLQTTLARHRDTRELCVLKFLDCDSESRLALLRSVQSVIRDIGRVRHPSLVVPSACLEYEDRVVVVSRFVPGIDLRDLMVRRGRLAPAVVTEIGRQLIDALAELETAGATHGDLRLSKVRLTRDGRVVLVETGFRSRSNPWQVIHDGHQADECDAVAPERIGQALDADSRSDMYALGCLLWQLLAGRPVFPTGDPLAKLAAHQTRKISDIRMVAPETPDSLADAIAQLVHRDRQQRPPSFQQLRQAWGGSRPGGRRLLAGFQKTVRETIPVLPGRSSERTGPRWALIGLALFAISGIAIGLADQGARVAFLNIADQVIQELVPDPTGTSNHEPDSREPTVAANDVASSAGAADPFVDDSFPLPDVRGLVRLESGRDYPAAEFHDQQRIVLRATGTAPARIVISGSPVRLSAPLVELDNVEFVWDRSQGQLPRAGALLLIRSDNLVVKGCRFQTATDPAAAVANSSNPARPVSLAWKGLQNSPEGPRSLIVENCIFVGPMTSVYLSDQPDEIRLLNCLKVGGGALLNVPQPDSQDQLNLVCDQITLRGAESLLRIRGRLDGRDPGELQLECQRCIFDLRSQGALFEWLGQSSRVPTRPFISVVGAGSVSRSDVDVLTLSPVAGAPAVNGDGLVSIEGISASPFRFRGPVSGNPEDSVVEEFQSLPRITAAGEQTVGVPGINIRRLPVRSAAGSSQPRVGARTRESAQ